MLHCSTSWSLLSCRFVPEMTSTCAAIIIEHQSSAPLGCHRDMATLRVILSALSACGAAAASNCTDDFAALQQPKQHGGAFLLLGRPVVPFFILFWSKVPLSSKQPQTRGGGCPNYEMLSGLPRLREADAFIPTQGQGGQMSAVSLGADGAACAEDGYKSSGLEASFAQDPLKLTKDKQTLCKALASESDLWLGMNMNEVTEKGDQQDPFSKICRRLVLLTQDPCCCLGCQCLPMPSFSLIPKPYTLNPQP